MSCLLYLVCYTLVFIMYLSTCLGFPWHENEISRRNKTSCCVQTFSSFYVLFMGFQFFPGWKVQIFLLTYLSSDILFSWGQEGLDSFFFFPFKKIKNHHLRTAFCIYSVYLAPGCLMLEFVQWSETCKCLNMQNQKGALSVCVFSLWLVVICVQESTQSGWSRRGEIIDGHVSLTGCWEELSVGIKEGEKRNCQKGDLREVEAKNKREET